MTAAFKAMFEVRHYLNVHSRLAAYVVAVTRVAEACRTRGWALPVAKQTEEERIPIPIG
jgi:glutamate dehydrogenase/leucine dehydrogenase